VALIQRDEAIQQIAPTAFDPSLCYCVCQGLSKEVRTGQMALDRTAHATSRPYFRTSSPVKDQEPGARSIRKRFSQLLDYLRTGRMQ
jgi:hypothetical protein